MYNLFPYVCLLKICTLCSSTLFEEYFLLSKPIYDKRKVTVQLNPSCSIAACSTTNNNIAYARLQGENDCLHYFFSAGGNVPPTLLMIKSSNISSYANITWEKFLLNDVSDFAGSVKVVDDKTLQPANIVWQNTVIFNMILEYNDTSGKANFSDPANIFFPPILLKNLTWDVRVSTNSVFIEGSSDSASFSTNSSIALEFVTYDKTGRNKTPPKLPHTCNSTDLNIAFNSLITRGSGSRFAVQMLLLANSSADLQTSVKKSIDDEYSPTVFEVDSLWWTPRQQSTSPQVFYEWRKVCYKSEDRSIKFSSDTAINDKTNITTKQPDIAKNKLVRGYYDNTLFTDEQAKAVVVTFGRSDDTMYNVTKYLAWTMTVGFGKPPADSFSLLVIIMLLAAVGIPLVVIVFGAIWMIMRRCSKKNGYTEISGSVRNPVT